MAGRNFSIGRSRPQVEGDYHEIQAIKAFYLNQASSSSGRQSSGSSHCLSSKYSDVRKEQDQQGPSSASSSLGRQSSGSSHCLSSKYSDVRKEQDQQGPSSASSSSDPRKSGSSHSLSSKYSDVRSDSSSVRRNPPASLVASSDSSAYTSSRFSDRSRSSSSTSIHDTPEVNAPQACGDEASGDTAERDKMSKQEASHAKGKGGFRQKQGAGKGPQKGACPKTSHGDKPNYNSDKPRHRPGPAQHLDSARKYNGQQEDRYTRENSSQDHRNQRHMSADGRRNNPHHGKFEKGYQNGKRPQNTGRKNQQSSAPQSKEGIQKTTLYIKVHQVITDIESLGQVLTDKVNTPDVELKPTETAIRRDDQFTYCNLTCDSTVAQTLMALILKDRDQFDPLIDCSFNDYLQGTSTDQYSSQNQNQPTEHRQQTEEKERERLKKQAEFEIKSMSEKALQKHREATDAVEKKIEACKSRLGDVYNRRETRAEIAALEGKLEELENQKKEFNTALDSLRAELGTTLEKDSFKQDLTALRKQLGVEVGRLKTALPMYARRRDVVDLIANNQVTILLAETGSGKSTQVVQYLMEAGFAKQGLIVCTQPRKVAVVSLASRVAEELATKVGHKVGYKTGLRSRKSDATRILYMTDHTLLNEFLTDPDLQAFSCVVVDEAHERSLYTDLLLTMIKRCLPRRPDLKVIITSATIDPQVFVSFFASSSLCPILRVSGRAFPVDVVWEDSASEENDVDYVDAAVKKVMEIHRKEPAGGGDILVFLTSAVEIQKCVDMTQQRLRDRQDFQCLPLHGKLQPDEQQMVFKPLEGNKRKIVYATNCAETSITIDGIRFVVDTGVAKEMIYDPKKKVNSLVVTTISQSSAEQRKGRAGRTASGTCYRLYSRQSYQQMDKISLPEILKIHLGQALLKLAQLGFTPDMYDFVQSPAQDAIQAALKTLHQLGALKDNAITDTGKWIARLPFDPKLGLMIFLGQQCGLLYDAIVLASLMNTGGSLFYRGSSDKDRDKLDKAKLKFSHQGGDGLTAMEVYKAWLSLGERERNKWCMANSVNAKAIRGAKDSVNDIVQILRKEMEVVQQFSEDPDAADKLRRMIFQCNVPSLCHYLGRDRAGYFAAQACRQVHIHPSSALVALADSPQWVVYDQLLKTSRDYITGITPVDDAWLTQGGVVDAELYDIDVDQVRQKKLDVAFTQLAGCHAFFAMVGPRFTKLRQYEEQCSTNSMGTDHVVIIEGSREAGQVKVYATGEAAVVEALKRQLTIDVEEAVREVRQEVRELTIGSEECGLRVLVGQGGQLTDILMPEETRKVFITRPSEDLTQEQVRAKFETCGDICYMQQFSSGTNWGFLVFRMPAQAEEAARLTQDDDCNVAELERRRTVRHKAEFKARLTWTRRPCKGIAFVDVSPAYLTEFLRVKTARVGDSIVQIKMSNKNPDESIFLSKLGQDVYEDLVHRSLLHAIGYNENTEGIISKISIVREKIQATTKKDLKEKEEDLKEIIMANLRRSSVNVKVHAPKSEQQARFSAQAFFTDPIEGYKACMRLRSVMGLPGLEVIPDVSASLQIQRPVYEACKGDLDMLLQDKLQDVELELEKGGADNWRLRLKADDMQTLVEARTFINDVIRGDVLDCNKAPALRHLLAPAGRNMLKEAQKQTQAYVCLDARTQTLAIHGSSKAATMMRTQINNYLKEVLSGTVEELTLKGDGRPPGLMKTLINTYNEDLEDLRQQAGLLAITINYRWHKVKLTGPPESIAKAKGMVEDVARGLAQARQQQQQGGGGMEEGEDCITCMCPVGPGELYRLEACAHPYCKDCIRHQVSVAVKDRHLPVLCCQEGCDTPLAWRDFNSLARLGHLKLSDLATSALSAYVLANRDKACFCTTPNCPMVFRLTSEEEAKTFQCPECSVRLCTGCRAQAHEGVTCLQLRSSDTARSGVEDWVKADKTRRRACPQCYVPIEKTEGCNKMVCEACRAIFCWLCGKKYPTARECYDHLASKHGGIFDLNNPLYR